MVFGSKRDQESTIPKYSRRSSRSSSGDVIRRVSSPEAVRRVKESSAMRAKPSGRHMFAIRWITKPESGEVLQK